MGNSNTSGGKQSLDWGRMVRTAMPRHELEFIMKIGRVDRDQALSLMQKHRGDREAVFMELAARDRP